MDNHRRRSAGLTWPSHLDTDVVQRDHHVETAPPGASTHERRMARPSDSRMTTNADTRPRDPRWLDQFRAQVLARGRMVSYRVGTIIVQEGEPAESLYWIISGELVVYVEDEDGHVLELNRLRADDYLGELLFGSPMRTASVRTVTAAKLCRVSHTELEALLLEQPVIALEIIRMLAQRLAALTSTVRGIALTDVYGRLQRHLTEHAAADAPFRVVTASQQEIADRVGASRSMVNRLLKDLEAGGYVAIERRRIRVLKALPRRW
jgi:CRP/FNR family transcriptional regulator, cyclic AMP receptor protein